MSAAKAISQGVPGLINSFPGWRLPTHCQAIFTTASSGVATLTTNTPGITVTETGTDGEYAMTFPPCRRAGAFHGNVSPATPGTASNHRHIRFDVPVPGLGTVTFRSLAANGGAIASPNDGSTVEINFWADFG